MIEAGAGPRVVLLAYGRLTGQNVKRAAAGAEGPVLDHYSAAATEAHLRAVGDPMLDAVPAELVGSVFCDSLEVYGADWTTRLASGVCPAAGLRRPPRAVPADGRRTRRSPGPRRLSPHPGRALRGELRRRAASAGRPAAAYRSGSRATGRRPQRSAATGSRTCSRARGGVGGEITQTRWASSAAHLYGRTLVSAEVWTWVHSPSFRATPLDLKGEAHEHFLNGINQLIGHGWPYSPTDAPGLGWFFYASGALDDRNPWWPAMPELTRYLSRLCWLLQQGEPVADVALYVPNEDLFATMGRAQGGSLDTWREANAADPEQRSRRRSVTAGLDYDLIDDEALAVTAPDRLSSDHHRDREHDPEDDRGMVGSAHVRPAARC